MRKMRAVFRTREGAIASLCTSPSLDPVLKKILFASSVESWRLAASRVQLDAAGVLGPRDFKELFFAQWELEGEAL